MKHIVLFSKIFAVLIAVQLLAGFTWGRKGRIKKLRSEAETMAAEIDRVFDSARESMTALHAELQAFFDSAESRHVDISAMNEAAGGRFYFFQDELYVRRFDSKRDECAIFASGAHSIGHTEQRHLKLLTEQEGRLLEVANQQPFFGRVSFLTVYSGGITCPGIDVTATITAKTDITALSWYQTTLREAQTGLFWMHPLISLAPEGWIQPLAIVVNSHGKPQGITAIDIEISKLGASLLNDSQLLIFLAYRDSTVFAASPDARDTLKLPTADPYMFDDYFELLEVNPQPSPELRLNDESHPDGFKQLAALILQDASEGEVTLANEKYQVVLVKTLEAGYYIVGLTQ